ncbi:hypothetical protein Vadar_004850 [Vaccinium darrowii]|uniref:Uncharacterized protein n=1 Tax=Vaccinium darrowii TaxID=229202 RepID=A0ACB7XWR5_9ERIC|nr:hypothetical protein Vadar_004850 [Vaccinium darrowii]
MGAASRFSRLPYGETFSHRATGRCSSSQLMIDFIAKAAGLPFLDAYKDTNGDFIHGVNFAVAGSTALSVDSLAKTNILSPVTTSSLGEQFDWMSKHFGSICNTSRGGNDINYALFQGKSIKEVKSLVPSIVQAIKNAVRTVISDGAVRVVVPAIRELKKELPNAVIAYGDYYKAFEWLYKNVDYLGFDTSTKQRACCGSGGDYNFCLTRMCGAPDVPVCQNPDQLISWDGIHLTQEAYKHMAAWLVDDLLPKLHCSS